MRSNRSVGTDTHRSAPVASDVESPLPFAVNGCSWPMAAIVAAAATGPKLTLRQLALGPSLQRLESVAGFACARVECSEATVGRFDFPRPEWR